MILPRLHTVVRRRGWVRVSWVALWRAFRSSWPVSSEDGPCFCHHRAAAVDDEEQDGRVVERARCSRVRHDLRCSPGRECKDGHEAQEVVPTVGWSGDADSGNGGSDEEQRGGRYG
jgi:hypothetical protein